MPLPGRPPDHGTAIYSIPQFDSTLLYMFSAIRPPAQSLPRGLTLSWCGSFARFWWQAEKKSTTTLSIQALPKGHSPSMKATWPPLQCQALCEALAFVSVHGCSQSHHG